jgi:hypothetical protein
MRRFFTALAEAVAVLASTQMVPTSGMPALQLVISDWNRRHRTKQLRLRARRSAIDRDEIVEILQ